MDGGAGPAQQAHRQPFEFSPILIGLVGIVAGAIAVAVYQCIAIACFNSRSDPVLNPTAFRRGQELARRRARPIRPNNNDSRAVARVLHLLPVFEYGKGSEGEGEKGTCAVCLGEFGEGEELRRLHKCGHSFHAPCVDVWLFSHANCPLCRADTSAPA